MNLGIFFNLKNWYRPNLKKKVNFLAAPVIEIVNLFCKPKRAQRIPTVRKRTFGNLSSTLYFQKKKTIKASP